MVALVGSRCLRGEQSGSVFDSKSIDLPKMVFWFPFLEELPRKEKSPSPYELFGGLCSKWVECRMSFEVGGYRLKIRGRDGECQGDGAIAKGDRLGVWLAGYFGP